MAATVRKVRLGAKAQAVLPKEARQKLGLKPGDSFAFVIDGEDIRVVRAPSDPFFEAAMWISLAA